MSTEDENLHTFIEPELEARVVAWTLGEASDFEAEEIARLVAEKPELALFKRRIEAVHGLVREAVQSPSHEMRLSPERREKLLKTIGGEAGDTAEVAMTPKRTPWYSRRGLIALAACLAIAVILAGLMMPVFGPRRLEMARATKALHEKRVAMLEDQVEAVRDRETSLAPENTFQVPEPLATPTPAATPTFLARLEPTERPAVETEESREEHHGRKKRNVQTGSSDIALKRENTALAKNAFDGIERERGRRFADEHGKDAVDSPGETGSTDGSVDTFWEMPAQQSAAAPGSRSSEVAPASGSVSGEPVVASAGTALGWDVNSAATRGEWQEGERKAGVVGFEGGATAGVSGGNISANGVTELGVNGSLFGYGGGAQNETGAGAYELGDDRRGGVAGEVAQNDKRAGRKTKVEEDRIEVVPLYEPTDSLVTKEYRVPHSFSVGKDARKTLESQGVVFPTGAAAQFLPQSNRLIVRNTQENLDLTDALVEAMAAPPSPELEETSAAEEPVSTFSLHVSDVSFKLAQAALAKGELPDPTRIRPEEFYNAFDYGDPPPATGEEVACRIEQSADPVLQQRNLVRIAMEVASTGRGAGQPLRLTVLLDTSGSMERADRVASVRRAMEVLASLLGPDDRVTVIGFARQPRLLADQLPGDQASKLVEIVTSTPSEGGTNLEEALRLAGEMATKAASPVAQNRIVLVTDGAANLGSADPARLASMIESLRRKGIAFDACGVGADGLDDEILESLTRKGDGRYYLLDRPEDADEGFARQLAGAFRPAAENVKVQVRFNQGRVGKYRLVGFEKHRLREEDFRNDKVDAAELASEEAAVALYQVEVLPDGEGELGEVFVRFRDAASGRMVERSWTMPFEAQAPAFDRAPTSMQLAGVAAMLAEKLRGGAMGSQVDLETLAPIVNHLRSTYAEDPRVQELVAMFGQMRQITGQ